MSIVAHDGFSAPTNRSGFNRQPVQMPLSAEKLGEQAGLAMSPEVRDLDHAGKQPSHPQPLFI